MTRAGRDAQLAAQIDVYLTRAALAGAGLLALWLTWGPL